MREIYIKKNGQGGERDGGEKEGEKGWVQKQRGEKG